LRARGLRRYGFHGLAFQSAWRQLSAAEPAARRGRAVFAHLGGGASLCAVLDGRSVDTTMSLTPLDGLPMASRCGSLDPGVVLHLLREPGLSADAIEGELSLHSGLLGLSGTTGDMQRLLASDSAEARLAIDIFVHRTAQGVAAMATTLGGIDDLVFSGGIGSHAAPIRAAIAEQLAWTGLRLDVDANAAQALRIDAPGSAIRAWVVVVQEDQELAAAAAEWHKKTS
jgi:acetate kinase